MIEKKTQTERPDTTGRTDDRGNWKQRLRGWFSPFMKRLDWYILGKFLGTFFFSILLIIIIVIVFDISEKIEDFIRHDLSLETIVFDYYLNFIPYFINLFSHLFAFIAIIFFTSRMASRTEIVAILNSGVSFRRFLRPYFVGAAIISLASLYLNNWLIPQSNKVRLAFEAKYVGSGARSQDRDIYRQISPGEIAYLQQYNPDDSSGYRFSLYQLNEKNELTSWIKGEDAIWQGASKTWLIKKATKRNLNGLTDTTASYDTLRLKLNMSPKDFERAESVKESMTWGELNAYIEQEKQKGSSNVQKFEIEKHKRIVYPFATFILTIIGVSLSSRKVRGGIGLHLGVGIAVAFGFILFMQIFASFAEASVMPAYIALWIPNVIFGVLALYLLRQAPK